MIFKKKVKKGHHFLIIYRNENGENEDFITQARKRKEAKRKFFITTRYQYTKILKISKLTLDEARDWSRLKNLNI